MNKAIKARWVAALCSGDYEQGVGHLRLDDRYCCLGVLADIVDPQGWRPDELNPTLSRHRGNSVYPDYSVGYACGLGQQEEIDLSTMNDGGKTFIEIADYIEENL